MVPRVLTIGLGVMLAMSALAVLGAAERRPGSKSRAEWRTSTPAARASADRILAAKSRDINRASVGETRVASFLAGEFGMSEQAILDEKGTLHASWGNLTIAHTIATSDKQGMTVAQVLHLHDCGMGWGKIAAGLGMNLDDAVSAVSAEGRVAMGRAEADGRTEPIRSH